MTKEIEGLAQFMTDEERDIVLGIIDKCVIRRKNKFIIETIEDD